MPNHLVVELANEFRTRDKKNPDWSFSITGIRIKGFILMFKCPFIYLRSPECDNSCNFCLYCEAGFFIVCV